MHKTAVKICGITNRLDATAAVGLGASALGFIFARSPRRVSPQKASDIIATIPPFVKTVGVFVNEDHDKIRAIKQYCGLDLIQLHGDETPDFCQALMPSAIKAFRVKETSDLSSIQAYCGNVRALLLDTYAADTFGGTGKQFDWNLALEIKQLGVPIILAGGLGPVNINKAISTVKPYAVDVNSCIEDRPGRKSYVLMQKLMEELSIGKWSHD